MFVRLLAAIAPDGRLWVALLSRELFPAMEEFMMGSSKIRKRLEEDEREDYLVSLY